MRNQAGERGTTASRSTRDSSPGFSQGRIDSGRGPTSCRPILGEASFGARKTAPCVFLQLAQLPDMQTDHGVEQLRILAD